MNPSASILLYGSSYNTWITPSFFISLKFLGRKIVVTVPTLQCPYEGYSVPDTQQLPVSGNYNSYQNFPVMVWFRSVFTPSGAQKAPKEELALYNNGDNTTKIHRNGSVTVTWLIQTRETFCQEAAYSISPISKPNKPNHVQILLDICRYPRVARLEFLSELLVLRAALRRASSTITSYL